MCVCVCVWVCVCVRVEAAKDREGLRKHRGVSKRDTSKVYERERERERERHSCFCTIAFQHLQSEAKMPLIQVSEE